MISKIGPYYYNFWQDAKNPRGLWRRTTLDEYRKAEPAWETVLDLDALGAAGEGELGLARGLAAQARLQAVPGLAVAGRGRRRRSCASSTSRRSRSSRTATPCPRPRAGSPGANADSVFVGTDFGPGSLTKSGYPRIVKEWKRGTPLEPGRPSSSRARPTT